MATQKQLAHELIDRLPDAQVSALVGLLEAMIEPHDPVSQALQNAPFDNEPETEEEIKDVQEARTWLANNEGRGIPHDEAMRRLGLK